VNIEEIQTNLQRVVKDIQDDFIYELLLAYGHPKGSVTRIQNGTFNLSKHDDEVIWKKQLYFKKVMDKDLHVEIDQLQNDPDTLKHKPRFIVLTDFQTLLAVDTKRGDTLDIELKDLPSHFDFFLPWAGMEKTQYQSENPADIKAAERLGRLYDLIIENNEEMTKTEEGRHSLNVFLTRLLFCFFAEDTGIFSDDIFTNSIASHTSDDGEDLQGYLEKLFHVLSTKNHEGYPDYLQRFPYVNGGLFSKEYPVPQFSYKSRKLIIESGELNWKEINPDIFGSMIQSVVHNDQRANMGMHYTSVTNIMKVIQPLFLDDLEEQLEKAEGSEKKLSNLLERLYNLKIFDPACGSGNFLIITYKELCKLEMEIFRQLQVINIHNWGTARSGIRLTQFYGIELDDFAHETAKLSLWLTEHQMNLAYKEVFGESKPTLPLQDSGNIANANAAQENWVEICPKENGSEVYILGNPPYLGFSNQDKDQKADMSSVFVGRKGFKRLDYISCWFWLAAKYITGTNSRFAFVSTNSIAQGEQVGLLWPNVFMLNLEIDFSHQAFKWTNNAKGMAGVTCVVIGVRNKSAKHKLLINNGVKQQVKNISPYLIEGNNSIVMKRGKTRISSLPEMIRGDMPIDGGNLILSNEEKECLLEEYPISGKFIRKFIGTNEFLKSTNRWCLWINDENVREALRIPSISRRVEAVRLMREKSTNKSTLEFAKTPHLFGQIRHMDVKSIIVPRTASERRIYIPVGFVDKETIVSDLASTIPYQSIFVFSIISSSLHMIWVRTVAGGLETRIRYSSGLCYNTFPFPEITDKQKTNLEDHVFNVLDEREKYPEKTMAELYDPDKMPAGLLKAHQDMDLAVEQCYRKKPFKNDEERLEYLFKLYEEMIAAEETGNA
jgi:hypothetical protein